MVDIQFRAAESPYKAIAFTRPDNLETIYLPTQVMKNMTHYFRKSYGLSQEQAKRATELYLEEIAPQVMAHEAAHLALGHIAQQEGVPPSERMLAYHNPIVHEIEKAVDYKAERSAVARAQKEYKSLR